MQKEILDNFDTTAKKDAERIENNFMSSSSNINEKEKNEKEIKEKPKEKNITILIN